MTQSKHTYLNWIIRSDILSNLTINKATLRSKTVRLGTQKRATRKAERSKHKNT